MMMNKDSYYWIVFESSAIGWTTYSLNFKTLRLLLKVEMNLDCTLRIDMKWYFFEFPCLDNEFWKKVHSTDFLEVQLR